LIQIGDVVSSLIAIDYDGTFTADPGLWRDFIASAVDRGHRVVCVTMRHPHEAIEMPCEIFYTGRRAKLAAATEAFGKIDIWIEDSPHWLFHDG
jgi:hypothetical protein